MKFKYSRYGSVLRPIIPILVQHGSSEIGYEVLVDSGADVCLFSSGIGEALGIEVKKGRPCEILGVGGKYSVAYFRMVTIVVGESTFCIEAGFMPDIAGHVMSYGLVGQKGFFDHFVVKFDLLKGDIELKQRK